MARPSKKNPTGAQSKPKQTPEVINLLKQAFSIGCTDKEACIHAGISESTYYEWKADNLKLSEEFSKLKNNPVMKAKKAVYDSLDNARDAQWYLERKCKDEFSLKVESSVKSQSELNITGVQFVGVSVKD